MSQQNDNNTLSMEERYPRNIPLELFDAWQLLKRTGDAEKLCKELGKSRPIIDRALKYGHVKKQSLAAHISRFFQQRVDREKNKGNKLLDAAKA